MKVGLSQRLRLSPAVRRRATVPASSAAKAPDLIGRNFTATARNTKYLCDTTYLSIGGGTF